MSQTSTRQKIPVRPNQAEAILVNISLLLIILVLSACSGAPVNPKTQITDSPDGASVSPFESKYSEAIHFLQPMFSTLDCTHVGKIEQGEVDEHFYDLYYYVDRDHDRIITQVEYVNSVAHSQIEKDVYIFKAMDVDADGIVSTKEYRAYVMSALEEADLNQDRGVSEAELDMAGFRRLSAKR